MIIERSISKTKQLRKLIHAKCLFVVEPVEGKGIASTSEMAPSPTFTMNIRERYE